jgi:uncharacterized short protein YbdD (DUF466 family)
MRDIQEIGRKIRQTARLMIGIPDYEAYAAHMRKAHPEAVVMTEAEFVRDRQDRRYGNGGKGQVCRCC